MAVAHTVNHQPKHQRGAALIAALAAVAILTILVMGLAASQRISTSTRQASRATEAARLAGYLALEVSLERLEAGLQPPGPHKLENASAELLAVTVRPAEQQDYFYNKALVNPRPGDQVLNIMTSARKGGRSVKRRGVYLVNIGENTGRTILMSENMHN